MTEEKKKLIKDIAWNVMWAIIYILAIIATIKFYC